MTLRHHGLGGLWRPESVSGRDEVVEGGGELEGSRAGGGGRGDGGGAAPRESTVGLHPEGRHRAPRASDHHEGAIS